MNASRCVGRVRGLAAVLGAGAVLTLGHGVAWADDDGSQQPRGSADSQRSHTHRPAAAGSRTPGARPASAVAESGNMAGTAKLGPTRQRAVEAEQDLGETPGALSTPNATGDTGPTLLPAAPATGQRVPPGRHLRPAAALAATTDVGPGPQEVGIQTGPVGDEGPSATDPDVGARLTPVAALGSGALGSEGPDSTASNTSTAVGASAATLASTTSVAPKAIAAAPSAPITLKVIVADMLTWAGLGRLVPVVPVPALPVPPVIETLWLAVRNALGRSDNIYLLGPQITLSGVESAQVLTPDGTRAVITTEASYTTAVTVIDMMSGRQVGTTLKFDDAHTPVVTTDGSRAVIVTSNNQAVVIDTATGRQVGAVGLSGALGYYGEVAAIGATRAVVAGTVPGGELTTVNHTQFAVIDTTTGKQIGVEGTVSGRAQWWSSVDADHFLVVSEENRPDNELSTPRRTQVVVLDTATGTQSSPVTLLGLPDERPLLSPDGSRALISADSPLVDQAQMAVIDTVTGAQIGSTMTFENRHLYGAVGVGDGSRALITLTTYDPATGKRLGGEALVIDTATGEQIGATATFPSTPEWSLLSADGTHALIAYTGGAEIVDTVTGTSTALAPGLAGTPKAFVSNRDGTRALIAVTVPGSPGYYPERPGTTQVTVVDTVTGTQIGTAISVPGDASGVVPSADGTRALIMTNAGLWAVFDTTTGQQIGATKFKLAFILSDGLARSDGTHVLAASALFISRLTMVDILTGRPVGNTVTIPGDGGIADSVWSVSADGSRALFSSYFRGTPGRTVIQVLGLGSL